MNATAPAPFFRTATAADLPPGYRWLSHQETTAAQDMLWDLAKGQWIAIRRPFIGLHTRHFTSVIRRIQPSINNNHGQNHPYRNPRHS